MTSVIEQAAERLAQLRAAGVEIPEINAPTPLGHAPGGHPTAVETAMSAAAAVAAGSSLHAHAEGVDADLLAPARVPVPVPVSRRVDIDLARLAANGFITPDSPRTLISDQFRVIKRPLIANAMGKGAATVKHGNLIMITSALAGEGKTYNSVNLAMSIAAELDHTVMLVDADVARPSVLRTLDLPNGPGLLDVLEGKAELADVLLRTNVDKLTLLPAGTPHRRATELLASEAMNRLLDDMATRYSDRIIIFDSPPLLLTTESRVLATHMGQIVIVVQAGRTLQSSVQHALSTIDSCPLRMMVLNKSQSDGAGGYGYGYGYGYGGGYGYGYGQGGGDAAPNAGDAATAAPAGAAAPGTAPADAGKAA